MGKRKEAIVIGLDLAGSPRRPTGACRLSGRQAATRILLSDAEILEYVAENAPRLVAVDAPLSLPPGRASIEDRNDSHFRICDLELRKRRIPFFPITLGPMRSLTRRGMALASRLRTMGIEVVEIYPGAAQDVWGIPRAARDRPGLVLGLRRLGLLGLSAKASVHELDAATGALAGLLYLRDEAEIYGDFENGAIVMPRPRPALGGGRTGRVIY